VRAPEHWVHSQPYVVSQEQRTRSSCRLHPSTLLIHVLLVFTQQAFPEHLLCSGLYVRDSGFRNDYDCIYSQWCHKLVNR
jgi:hypothetical protein